MAMRFTKSDILNNIIKLSSGSSAVIAIPLLLSPILSRLYEPASFGIAALFGIISAIVGLVASLQYDNAVLIPEKEDDAINVLYLALISSILCSLTYCLLLFTFSYIAPHLFFESLWLTPVSGFFTGLYISCYKWYLRKKRFKKIIIAKFLFVALAALLKVVFGLMNLGTSGLIYGIVLAQFTGAAYYIIRIFYIDTDRKDFCLAKVKRYLYEFKNFPLATLPGQVLKMFQDNIFTFFIGGIWGTAPLGQYSMSTKVLNVPIYLLGNPMADVIFQELSSKEEAHFRLTRMFKKTSLSLLPVFIIIFLLSPYLFPIIFGSNWKDAGIYAQMISPWFYAILITLPVEKYAMLINKQKECLKLNILLTVVQVTILTSLNSILSLPQILATFAIVGLFGKLLLSFYLIKSYRGS